jgi:hypothetical protein
MGDVNTFSTYNKNIHPIRIKSTKGAFTIKGASQPKVWVLSKDYVFSSLKHGFHVLDKAHYRMIVPTLKF